MISEINLLNKEAMLGDQTESEVMLNWIDYYQHNDFIKPNNIKLLYSDYTYEDYSGDAYVLGYNTDSEQFFEVHGGHCSCYGLEGQWDEEYFDNFEQLKYVIIQRIKARYKYSRSADASDDLTQFLEITKEDLHSV